MKDRLVFTTGDLAESDVVGASVISKGTEIDNQTINSQAWLNTAAVLHDDSGALITDANPLPVDIADAVVNTDIDGIYDGANNTDPDNIGLISHTRGDLTDTGQTQRTTAGSPATVTSANISTLNAIDVNAIAYAENDTSGDLEFLSKDDGTGGLNVQIAGQDSNVAVTDAALADSSVAAASNTVTTGGTSESVVSTALTSRKYLWVYNNDNKKVFLGPSGVTSSDGFPVSPGSYLEMRAGPNADVHFVDDQAGTEIRTLELS